MKTTIEIYNMDNYASFEDAEASGGVYKTVLYSQEDAVINAVLNGMKTAVNAVDAWAQFDYKVIKEG